MVQHDCGKGKQCPGVTDNWK